ncbi:MAG: radical SAM protein [Deltaproteobacteria bacterium]|nr:radical SAM protein [Deltaproteobacteria bacterium]
MEPAYLNAYKNNILQDRIEQALEILSSCTLCPRDCKANRLQGETGYCRTGRYATVSSAAPHFGEEAPLVGRYGSGTIFFTHCNLLCIFCQNCEISHKGEGTSTRPEALAEMMLALQNQRVHNINFVSPSHVVPQILEALPLAIEQGLRIPLIYNTGGYDSLETLQLLDGIVDIYMPDIKFGTDIPATFYCKAPDYPVVVRKAIAEMHRQTGDLCVDGSNRAVRGLLVRHLVMPDDLASTKKCMNFLADEISHNTYLNIMNQYHPCGELERFPELQRRITDEEYNEAVETARAAGLHRLDRKQRDLLLHWR